MGWRHALRELAEPFIEFEQEIARPAMAFVDEVVAGNTTIKLRRKQ
jgi:hypothetical protein